MESVWSVSKLSTESVGLTCFFMFFCTVILTELSMFCVRLSHFIIKFELSRRELVANCVHTADTTQLDSFVASASAVCIGHNECHKTSPRGTQFFNLFFTLALSVGSYKQTDNETLIHLKF